ncbi:PPR domain-containing protein/PPR_2 domain-containing protein [Cephalotus follicularis]|uniref:PPR domain-containing protein/PPR_2 domain-containing protein n=1 Tax=Cephalotus follicularis TaxID=3775 RepID=A0A1Q3D0V6_CEPFO|nr:PPR domain-containing protein/PPR_2 domain-containing protein [Cephalotus follicularis]
MKLTRLVTVIFKNSPCFSHQNGLMGVSSYSSKTTTSSTTTTRIRKPWTWSGSMHDLYRRISPVGDPTASIVPILNQWVAEGRNVHRDQMYVFIREFRYYKRYTHALQLSMWMTDKMYFKLTSRDICLRLDLIAKVHGIEQSESYFNNIPLQLRCLEVYSALFNCYARVKSVEKAEAVLQKMRDLGLARTTLTFNVLLNLYYETGNYEKVDNVMQEMEAKGISFDKYTYTIRFNAYSSASDIEGMDKILASMECDPNVVLDWTAYASVANGYAKAGLTEKALAMLKKSEGLITTSKKRSVAYNFLLTQYAAIGKKDEVLRLWEDYQKKVKVLNQGYISLIPSLLKFDDIEKVEKIFEEWESRNLAYDIRIPNLFIGACCRKGLLAKAEALVNRVMSNGGKPDAFTWYYLATGYLQSNQTPKAVEMLKEAITACKPRWKPNRELIITCLDYLKREGDLEGAGKLIRLLRAKDIVSSDVQERLLNYMKNENSNLDALSVSFDDAVVENE